MTPPLADHAPHDHAPGEIVVSVRDVCARQGGQQVLDHIQFDIRQGDFIGLVGPNGAGKSTLLRVIMGLHPTTCGSVEVCGSRADTPGARRRIGYVPQHVVNVDADLPMSAFEVALLGRVGRRGLFRRLNEHDRRITREAMAAVGVEHLAERPISQMSGGQRQRVFLAKALAAEPEILILDEPTTGVDPKARADFYKLLDTLNHDLGMTLLLVSHDTQAIALSAHRLVALNRTIVYDGEPGAFEEEGGFGAAYDFHLHHGEESP